MYKIPVTIHALLLITFSCVKDFTMCQHGTSLIRNIKDISVAFQALIILERRIGLLTVLFMIVFILYEVDNDVFDTVRCFCIKEIKGIVWGRKMAVHTICNKTLGIVDMSRCFPGVVGETNFMAPGTELGRRSPDHCVVGDAENGEGNEDPKGDKYGRLDGPHPERFSSLSLLIIT